MKILSIYLHSALALTVINKTQIVFRPMGILFLFTSCSRSNHATGKPGMVEDFEYFVTYFACSLHRKKLWVFYKLFQTGML